MAILPITMSRVTDLMSWSSSSSTIESTQAQLLQVENEIATGQKVSQVSDDPGAAVSIMQLTHLVARRTQFTTNINSAQSQLSNVDSTLSSLSNLLLQAQNLASANVSSTTTQSQRNGAAEVAKSLITSALNLANTSTNGMYLFGGASANTQPFVNTNGGIQFVGSTKTLSNVVNENTQLSFQVSGQDAFGALSSRVTGSADLTPAVSGSTLVSDLRGASWQGVALGSINLSNGTVTKILDLSNASSLSDVVNAINTAGVGGITASLSTSGLNLTGAGTDNITVTDVKGGSTASNLGIATPTGGAGAGIGVTGVGLNPRVTLLTPLADLKNGAGISGAGLVMSNGTTNKTIAIPAGGDVESLLNAINGAKLGVTAQIDPSGVGIDVLNATQGLKMSIGENGGTTASDLGIRSFSPATLLSDLHGGKGVQASTSGPDFQITSASGSSFSVSLTGATTVQNVIDTINAAATGSGVTASFATTGNGLVLTDTSGGTGTLSVTPLNASTAAKELGLTAPASGNLINGGDMNKVEPAGVFSDLQALVTALQKGDTAGITEAGGNLQSDYNQVTDVRAAAGAQVESLQAQQTQITSANTATQTLLSNLQNVDMTTAISQFQALQTALQGALTVTAKGNSMSLLNFLG